MAEQSISALIWATADLLRGDYKQSEYGKIILPFTLLRRLECVLDTTRDEEINSIGNEGSEIISLLFAGLLINSH